MVHKILAVGDCNTLGVGEFLGASYPERVAKLLACGVRNCAYTMSTSREGLYLLRDNLTREVDCVIIQFGLVDAYHTFKYSPYVLYYPDNLFRKQWRSLVKKYKKICRKSGLNDTIGQVNVVPEKEYRNNLLELIHMCGDRHVVLVETIPHHDPSRNPAIQRYNVIAREVSSQYQNCIFVKLFDGFKANMEEYYLDATHANGAGYDYAAGAIARALERCTGAIMTDNETVDDVVVPV